MNPREFFGVGSKEISYAEATQGFGEFTKIQMRGRWRDKYILHGQGDREVETEWRSNIIVNTAAIVVAGLLRRYDEDAASAPDGWKGLSYMAVGSGLASWDSTPPTTVATQTQLVTETFRKSIPTTDQTFLDAPLGSPQATPSRFIKIQTTFGPSEANGDLREFMTFGGDANAVANSGHAFNWVVHPLITKDSSLSIVRTVEFEILEP